MIQTRVHRYDGPGGPFSGSVSHDDASAEPRPGVMIAHAFGGQGAFDVEKAIALAELGYVGFAIDLYGEGRRATSPAEANALMTTLDEDRALLASRLAASLAALKALPEVDPSCTAAIGFCFGGKCVLDLARSGADVRGVVSFHGLYDAPTGIATPPIVASILALHGWDDPLATPDAVQALARELTARGADWQLHAFGHTGHSFTNPRAQAAATRMVYEPRSSDRAWRLMRDFLDEAFLAE
jgi:dienelactone hydrolase